MIGLIQVRRLLVHVKVLAEAIGAHRIRCRLNGELVLLVIHTAPNSIFLLSPRYFTRWSS